MAAVFLCALCDGRGTLFRLKPSKWYACADCVRTHGDKAHTLLAIVDRLKTLIDTDDPRMALRSNQEAALSLSSDLIQQLRKESSE
jgi:hypothetical protein